MLNETIKREGIHVCNKAEVWYFMFSNLMNTFLTHIKTLDVNGIVLAIVQQYANRTKH